MYNLCFYGIQTRFKAIPVGFRFSVFSVYMERKTEVRLKENAPIMPVVWALLELSDALLDT